MLLKGAAAARALAQPDGSIRLYVLAGPDEAGSRALSDAFSKAMGASAERVDLHPRDIKETPSRLADEVAAFSLFGDRRWIYVHQPSGGGDEWCAGATAILATESPGNPVVISGSGMTARSKLVQLAQGHGAAVAIISYLPEGAEADRLAAQIAEAQGVTMAREAARALADATGGDRALMAREAEKLALYLDASPDQPRRADLSDWLAIGADTPEEDVGAAVNKVLGGRIADLPGLFAELAAMGTSEIRLVRALTTRALLLARLRTRVDRDRMSSAAVVEADKSVFWKERGAVQQQVERWSAVALARLIDRLYALERGLKAPDNPGMLLLRNELLWISRAAAGAR
jgi:DNA polymerase III subunit delta